MSQFMGYDSGKFTDIQSCHQWQPDGKHQIIFKQAPESGSKMGRRIDITMDIDATGNRRPHHLAKLTQKPEKKGVLLMPQR